LSAQDELMIPSRASWLYCAMLFAQVGNNTNCNSNDIIWLQFISAVNVVQELQRLRCVQVVSHQRSKV
jgi:hypothetical protein